MAEVLGGEPQVDGEALAGRGATVHVARTRTHMALDDAQVAVLLGTANELLAPDVPVSRSAVLLTGVADMLKRAGRDMDASVLMRGEALDDITDGQVPAWERWSLVDEACRKVLIRSSSELGRQRMGPTVRQIVAGQIRYAVASAIQVSEETYLRLQQAGWQHVSSAGCASHV